MRKFPWLPTAISFLFVIGLTTVVYFYTAGYRLAKNPNKPMDLAKTGMVSAKSLPDGASAYLDGILLTATNDTIPGVEPGMHKLKIAKKGFVEWQKEVEVYAQLVTDITAVLVSQTPRLEPLTNAGARMPSISPNLTKIAFFSKDETSPGVLIIPVSSGLNIFKSNPTVALKDTKTVKYSDGKSISWSPDEKTLLVEMGTGTNYLVDLETDSVQTTLTPDAVREEWQKKLGAKRLDFIQKLELPEDISSLALSRDVLWAPDDKKFMYKIQKGDALDYRVYNMEKPLPIGEKVDTTAFTTNAGNVQPRVTWYADSYHLILTEGNIEKDGRGSVSLIRIDGTNKTEIYNNTLFSDSVYGTPNGDRLIILTSFKSNGQTDLYTVSLR